MTSAISLKPVIFGEIVFDCFESGERRLGGAPFNVSWNLHKFGVNPKLISAVGDDALGNDQLARIRQSGMDCNHIQIKPGRASGHVNVTDNQGEPEYEIVDDVAFDCIENAVLPQVDSATLLYYGSLALRHSQSQSTLEALFDARPKRFVDVNLRDPWWNQKKVVSLLQYADFVKLNADELNKLAGPHLHEQFAGSEDVLNVGLAQAFKLEYEIVNLLVTLGGDGAAYFDPEGQCHQVSAPVRQKDIVDTVGAGDAFSSVVILAIIYDWDWDTALLRAQEFASYVVGQRGAICEDDSIYHDFLSLWGLARLGN